MRFRKRLLININKKHASTADYGYLMQKMCEKSVFDNVSLCEFDLRDKKLKNYHVVVLQFAAFI